jgi:hypothetical protein
MNKLYLISILFSVLVSCQKEETPISDVPDWFLPQIEELEKSGHCFDCTISEITYENKKYYHLYCGYWSCIYCKLYDSNGSLANWDTEEFNNFLKDKKDEMVIWKCGDKIN